ncbi:MAG: alpha-xylosidase, partial [Ruminococcaceae bacterium]|nr:alpha-xylosidase [Oscillospiraceae bacterium]
LMDAFKIYKEKGIAPVRALVSDYTDDPETYHIDDEYLFCENLLVAPIIGENDGRKVYLPAGEWVDFFTGEKQESGWFEVETTNIPVYKRIK